MDSWAFRGVSRALQGVLGGGFMKLIRVFLWVSGALQIEYGDFKGVSMELRRYQGSLKAFQGQLQKFF